MFKDTLICDDAASVQVVSFARYVGVRSVALNGDAYELSRSGVLCVLRRIRWKMCGGTLRPLSAGRLRDVRQGRHGKHARAIG